MEAEFHVDRSRKARAVERRMREARAAAEAGPAQKGDYSIRETLARIRAHQEGAA